MAMRGPFTDPMPLTISVPERMDAMGYPTTGGDGLALATACGQAMRDWWIGRYGTRPVTWLTRKSSGRGSHHKARYPAQVQADMERIIREVAEARGVAPADGTPPAQMRLL